MIRAVAIGGAFNPPTIAHISLAHYAMKAAGAEKAIFIPSKMHYVLDEQKKDFAFTDEERLEMLERIAFNREWMDVCPYEIQADHQPRTYETLSRIREDGYEVKLVFGSDKLKELQHGWKYVDKICKEFGIICFSRGDDKASNIIRDDPYLHSLSDFITCIKTPERFRNISSTKARGLYITLKDNPDDKRAAQELRKILPEELDGLKEWL